MKKLLNFIKSNKKRLTYIREISQSRTYYVASKNRQNFIDSILLSSVVFCSEKLSIVV